MYQHNKLIFSQNTLSLWVQLKAKWEHKLVIFLMNWVPLTFRVIHTLQINTKLNESSGEKKHSFQLPCCTSVPLHYSVSLDYLQWCSTDDESSEGEEGKSAVIMPQIIIHIQGFNLFHPILLYLLFSCRSPTYHVWQNHFSFHFLSGNVTTVLTAAYALTGILFLSCATLLARHLFSVFSFFCIVSPSL